MKGICQVCGERPASEMHHIFNGPMRKKSEEYGAVIPVCRLCHDRIHRDINERNKLKAEAQLRIMAENCWSVSDFRGIFKKSYI